MAIKLESLRSGTSFNPTPIQPKPGIVGLGASAANFKADKKAVGCIDQWVSGTDVLTLQCYTSKPTTNIGVRIIW